MFTFGGTKGSKNEGHMSYNIYIYIINKVEIYQRVINEKSV